MPCRGVHWGQLESVMTSLGQPLASSQSPCSSAGAGEAWPPAPNALMYQSGKNTHELPVLTTVGIHNLWFSQGRWQCFVLQTEGVAFTLVMPFCVCPCLCLLDIMIICFLSANVSFRVVTKSLHLLRIRASQNPLTKEFFFWKIPI